MWALCEKLLISDMRESDAKRQIHMQSISTLGGAAPQHLSNCEVRGYQTNTYEVQSQVSESFSIFFPLKIV